MAYDEILVPVDGSDNAELAATRAIDAAGHHDATVHVLYVVEKTRSDPVERGLEETLAEEIARGNDVVASVLGRATEAGVEAVPEVDAGVPRTTIEAYAGEYGVDLIVIGSTGASAVTEKLLGTVAKYVVNEAPADVLVVRPDTSMT